MQKNISNILNEWFYRLPNGYATQPYDDSELEVLQTILNENNINAFPIIENLKKGVTPNHSFVPFEKPDIDKDEKDILTELEVLKIIKRVWTKIKSKVKGLFANAMDNKLIGDVEEIIIPAQKVDFDKTNLSEDAIAAIKGNYNEALTCDYVIMKDGVPDSNVDISKKYRNEAIEIKKAKNKWRKDLEVAAKDTKQFEKEYSIIEAGSKGMANYLIGNAKLNQSTIIGIYLDNLAFQEGAEFKADIRVALQKGDELLLDSYSLKLYSSKSVGLANGSPVSFARLLVGDAAAERVATAIENDTELQSLISNAKDIVKQYKQAKKVGDTELQAQLFKARTDARNPINPRLAQILFNELDSAKGTPEFAENLLRMLGYEDKDTKMLMAVVKNPNKVEILDKHPELDLANIRLEISGVSIYVKGPNGKTLVTISTKEGERKAVSGRVSFAGIEPVDMSQFDDGFESS